MDDTYEGHLPHPEPQAPRSISIEEAEREARKANTPLSKGWDKPQNPGSEQSNVRLRGMD